uniref:Acid phosphatase n=1 Tax=Panagrolaimus sp. JU765 TaxID=591449 RepID=A0AC34QIF7_9BILA
MRFLTLFFLIVEPFLLINAILDDAIVKETVRRDRHTKLVIFGLRHGNRNPGKLINESKGYFGFEGPLELTSIGKRQGYAFGKELRSFLQGLLAGNYLPSEASFYTSSSSRTQMTLQAVLAGLFPPRSFAVWNLALDWSPVPYQIDDPMLRMFNVTCPESDSVWKPIDDETLDAIVTDKNENKQLLEYISAHTGWSPTLKSAANLADNIDQFELHNFPLPQWLEVENFSQSTNASLAEMIMEFQEYPQITCAKYMPCRNLMSGVWLQTLVDRLQSLANSTDDAKPEKLLGFVSHTEIVLSAMKSMGLVYDRIDPSAGFILEIRDTPTWAARFLFHEPLATDEHVIYKGIYNEELKKLATNDEWIPLSDLIDYLQPSAISNWPVACGIESKDTGDVPSDTDKLIADVLEVAKAEKNKFNCATTSSFQLPVVVIHILNLSFLLGY